MSTCIIPAKGTSTRIPGKNIKLFHGKPILAYSIETARASGLFDDIVVSTDSEEVARVAAHYGAQVMMRDSQWCTDDVGPLDVARYCLAKMIGVQMVCVLYPTAPLLLVSDLLRGYKALRREGAAYSVSIMQEPFRDAGQFFWCRSWALRERLAEFADHTVLVPVVDCVDINTMDDWQKAEALYAAR